MYNRFANIEKDFREFIEKNKKLFTALEMPEARYKPEDSKKDKKTKATKATAYSQPLPDVSSNPVSIATDGSVHL